MSAEYDSVKVFNEDRSILSIKKEDNSELRFVYENPDRDSYYLPTAYIKAVINKLV